MKKIVVYINLIIGVIFIIFGILLLDNRNKKVDVKDKVIDTIKFNDGVQYTYDSGKIVIEYKNNKRVVFKNGKTTIYEKGKKIDVPERLKDVKCTKNLCKKEVRHFVDQGNEYTKLVLIPIKKSSKVIYVKVVTRLKDVDSTSVQKVISSKNKDGEDYYSINILGNYENIIFRESNLKEYNEFMKLSKSVEVKDNDLYINN